MIRRAIAASLIGLTVRVATMWRVGHDEGARVVVRSWHGFPYADYLVPSSKFVVITSSSTVALSFTVLAIVVIAAIGKQHPVRTLGWMFSGVGLLTSLIVDATLHHLRYPYTDPVRMRWAVGAAVVVIAVTGLWFALSDPTALTRLRNGHRAATRLGFGVGAASLGLTVVVMALYATTGNPARLH